MNKMFLYSLATASLLLASCNPQPPTPYTNANPSNSEAASSNFNEKTVVKIKGHIVAIFRNDPSSQPSDVQIIVRTAEGDMPVQLAPTPFVDRAPFTLELLDNVEVKGSKVTSNGHTLIIAQEISKGNNMLKLRDKKGQPLWMQAPSTY